METNKQELIEDFNSEMELCLRTQCLKACESKRKWFLARIEEAKEQGRQEVYARYDAVLKDIVEPLNESKKHTVLAPDIAVKVIE
jgi:hypothetical protein